MLRSMTGFARVVFPTSKGTLTIEARSVNHRFLDIFLKMPQRYSAIERKIKKEIENRFARGRIDVAIILERAGAREIEGLCLNIPLARSYHNLYRQLKDELLLQGEIDIHLMARIKELITFQEEPPDLETEWVEIEKVFGRCLDSLQEMREEEGRILFQDIEARVDRITTLNDEIQTRSSEVKEGFGQRLEERIKGRLNGLEIDPARLHQEIVFFSEKSDISEECVRLNSHIKQFRNLASSPEPVGRKLDFLLQEMNREATTIGAKATDAPIAHMVVEMKGELEKIREQIQNIE